MSALLRLTKAQLIIYGLLAIVVIIALIIVAGGGRRSKPPDATITIWGFLGDRNVHDPLYDLLDDFKVSNENIKVDLILKNPQTYEQDLINALASNTGPDIFFLDDSQITKHKDKIQPFIATSASPYTVTTFRSDFADIFHAQLISDGVIIGFPLYLDTLALYYNKDFFNAENIPAPPATWDAFVEQVKMLNRFDTHNDLQRSGAALGLANVEHSTDIVSALFLQAGDKIINSADKTVELAHAGPALDFYVSFSAPEKKNYSWSNAFVNSFEAFADEKAATMIGYASDIERLRIRNPHLNFGIAPLPQIKEAGRKVNFGRYRFATVSRLSKSPQAAWSVIRFLTSKTASKKYIEQAHLPPARRDLVVAASPDPLLSPFYGQSLSAQGWLKPGAAEADDIFHDMIQSAALRTLDTEQAVSITGNRLTRILQGR